MHISPASAAWMRCNSSSASRELYLRVILRTGNPRQMPRSLAAHRLAAIGGAPLVGGFGVICLAARRHGRCADV